MRDQKSSSDPVMARAADLLSAAPPLDFSQRDPRSLPDPIDRSAGMGAPTGAAVIVLFTAIAAAAATLHAGSAPRAPSHAEAMVQPEPRAPVVAADSAAVAAPPVTVSIGEHGPTTVRIAKAPSRESNFVEDESALMVRAVRALRREGDPAHAQTLAEQSLSRFPRGAQVEEAMALVMEAASARGDAAGARHAASAYLDRFHAGRFVDRADRILASPAK